MDFVGYAALGGLERVTIVAGAIIIGYWGYRLYAGEKAAGLVFMGLAVLVLVGALATGTSHLRSVGEGLQLASVPAPETASAVPATEPEAVTATEPSPSTTTPVPAPTGAEAPESAATPAADAEPAAAARPATDSDPADAAQEPAATETDLTSPVRLATGAELGGRIVSVKSENVSLEWATQPE
ncbi:MAG: hypothetical protein AB7I04_02875 [Pseudomonadales bacterium]